MRELGLRRHARCPKCASLERNRIQYLVLQDLSKLLTYQFTTLTVFQVIIRRIFIQIEQNGEIQSQKKQWKDINISIWFLSALSEASNILIPNLTIKTYQNFTFMEIVNA